MIYYLRVNVNVQRHAVSMCMLMADSHTKVRNMAMESFLALFGRDPSKLVAILSRCQLSTAMLIKICRRLHTEDIFTDEMVTS